MEYSERPADKILQPTPSKEDLRLLPQHTLQNLLGPVSKDILIDQIRQYWYQGINQTDVVHCIQDEKIDQTLIEYNQKVWEWEQTLKDNMEIPIIIHNIYQLVNNHVDVEDLTMWGRVVHQYHGFRSTITVVISKIETYNDNILYYMDSDCSIKSLIKVGSTRFTFEKESALHTKDDNNNTFHRPRYISSDKRACILDDSLCHTNEQRIYPNF